MEKKHPIEMMALIDPSLYGKFKGCERRCSRTGLANLQRCWSP